MVRNRTIDIAKGLGILLVVFGHNWIVQNVKGELFRVIFSFHVPLFFFLSGIFLKESISIREFASSKSSSLLKPYFTVLLALYFIKTIKEARLSSISEAINSSQITNIIYGTGATIEWAQLWFLPHLFVSSLFTLLIIKLVRTPPAYRLSIIAILLLAIGVRTVNLFFGEGDFVFFALQIPAFSGLPWSVDLLPITSAFLLFGYLLRDWVNSLRFNGWMTFTAVSIFSGLHFYFDQIIDLNMRIYDSLFISSLQAATGIYIVLSLSTLIARYKISEQILAYIGSGTLFILIFHAYIQGRFFGVLSSRIPYTYTIAVLSFIVGSLLPLIFFEITKRSKALSSILLSAK